jgi:CheY-like chemotaxis protein
MCAPAFIVDQVAEVLKIPKAAIEPAPQLSKDQSRLLSRMANLEKQKRMVQLIDPPHLMEKKELAPWPRSRDKAMIKLLIVDDSALMRRQLMTVFQAEGGFRNTPGQKWRRGGERESEFRPDVVTLDINMPEMDGLTALSLIMAERPVAVVMVSSLTEQGALATFEALNLGAVDYITKPGGTISLSIDKVTAELVAKVRSAASARSREGKEQRSRVRERLCGGCGRSAPRVGSAASSPCLPTQRSGGWAGGDWRIHRGAARAGDCAVGAAGKLSLAGAGGAAHAGRVYQGLCRAAGPVLRAFRGGGGQRGCRSCRAGLHRKGRRGHDAGQPGRQTDRSAGAGECAIPLASFGRVAGAIRAATLRSVADDGSAC